MGYGPWGHKELDTTERLHLPLYISGPYSYVYLTTVFLENLESVSLSLHVMLC